MGLVAERRSAKKYLLVSVLAAHQRERPRLPRTNQRGKVSKKFLRTGLALSGRQQAM